MLVCQILNMGRAGYDSALDVQENILAGKIDGDETDYLILVEHDPVVTLGRSGTPEDVRRGLKDLRRNGIELRDATRGGAATYHGPGQLVGYPIINLARHGRDVHRYLRRLENCIIEALSSMGIAAERDPDRTGVWTDGSKIASIGIAVRRWITYHGFAVNVGDDLTGFEAIVPCGMDDCRMVSVSSLLGRTVAVDEFVGVLVPEFGKEFGYRMQEEGKPVLSVRQ